MLKLKIMDLEWFRWNLSYLGRWDGKRILYIVKRKRDLELNFEKSLYLKYGR